MKTIEYKIDALIEATVATLQEEEAYKMFLTSWTGGWFESKSPQEQVNYTKYSERESAAWNALQSVCKTIDVDMDTLIPVVKAINRYEKHNGRYDRAIHTCFMRQDSFRMMVAKRDWDYGHYQSTGRKIK
jgi:hypothetical protein